MFENLSSYDPSSVSSEQREQIARIIRDRSESLRASADLSDLRGRAWTGETGLEDIIDLKAAELSRKRSDYTQAVRAFLKESVDIDAMKSMFPVFFTGLLQHLKVPLPVLLEILGVDMDVIPAFADALKDLISGE